MSKGTFGTLTGTVVVKDKDGNVKQELKLESDPIDPAEAAKILQNREKGSKE